jgi:hypothetical protein
VRAVTQAAAHFSDRRTPGLSGVAPALVAQLVDQRPQIADLLAWFWIWLERQWPAPLARERVACFARTKADGRVKKRAIVIPEALAQITFKAALLLDRPLISLSYDLAHGRADGLLFAVGALQAWRHQGLAILSVDVKAAYDSLPHQLIVSALREVGAARTAALAEQYLRARTLWCAEERIVPPAGVGGPPGACWMPVACAAAVQSILNHLPQSLSSRVRLITYIDNVFVAVPPHMLDEVLSAMVQRFRAQGSRVL